MKPSKRNLFQQGPMLQAMASFAVSSFFAKKKPRIQTPTPWQERVVAPRSPHLIDDYVRWSGASISKYSHHLPAHFFPQWGMPFLSELLGQLPYSLLGILNQGCRITRKTSISRFSPLCIKARLESITEKNGKVRIHQRMITGTTPTSEELDCDIYSIIKVSKTTPKKREELVIPSDAKAICEWELTANEGLHYAILSGDFNPIHWIKPMAQLAGFKCTILHGFATLAKIIEGMETFLENQHLPGWKQIDVRFIRPLLLPNRIQLWVGFHQNQPNQLWVSNATGEIFMIGHWLPGPLPNQDNQNSAQ